MNSGYRRGTEGEIHMMRKSIVLHGLGSLALVFGLALAGCSSDNNNDAGTGDTGGGGNRDATTGNPDAAGGTDAAGNRDAMATDNGGGGGMDGGGGNPDATMMGMDATAGGATQFATIMSGAEETPAVTTTALGGATLTLNGMTLSYHVTHNVQNATMMHIHKAAVGTPGGVVFAFPSADMDQMGTFTLDASQIADLQAGLYYVNVHSMTNQMGEIRGQIGTGSLYSANLTGDQETPAVTTNATGKGYFVLDGMMLRYHVIHDVMNATMMHIHKAAAGMPGGVVFAFPNANMDQADSFTLDASQVTDLNGSLYYVNVHSMAFPDGEIRGQILPVQ
jgi:CHRD domain-containing protein